MRIAVIGNGNWGTAVSKLIARNIVKHDAFDPVLIMWTYEEENNGLKLSEEINKHHTNQKYLPGIKLPDNIESRTAMDLSDCGIVLFCLPHQFINKLKEFKFNEDAFGINLSKGLILDGHDLCVPSKYISKMLNMECGSMMGANIATEVAEDVLSEATVGYTNKKHIEWFEKMFSSEGFLIEVREYDSSMEVCGGVKNIISIAYGIADGMKCGKNTLALVFRRGLIEMKRISALLGGEMDVLASSCVGDLLVSCLSGRNYKCGYKIGSESLSVSEIEESMNGQKLQGPETAKTVVEWLKKENMNLTEFPLIYSVYKICYENAPTGNIFKCFVKTE